jgi:hypothetical protein
LAVVEERIKDMTDGLDGIIAQLEHQRAAIERALAALREAEGIEAPASSASPSSGPATCNGGMTPAGRKRLSAALKKRWAAKKAAAAAAGETPQAPAPRKVSFTAEGRRRLAEAMKRRWAVKRAASAVKKAGRKKRAAKKAA